MEIIRYARRGSAPGTATPTWKLSQEDGRGARRGPLVALLVFLVTSLSLIAAPALGSSAAETLAASPPLIIVGATADATHIVFATAGRLWRAPLAGGGAEALTDGVAGEDYYPSFSPDSDWLAFSRDAGGNDDVYVMPNPSRAQASAAAGGASAAAGGAGAAAERRTYHPKADVVRGWTPDSRGLLFATSRDGDGIWRLYTVSRSAAGAAADFPQPLPLPKGDQASFSPDGRRLAYNPHSFGGEGSHYRYYRGGMTSPLWIADLEDSRVRVVAEPEANHRFPVWVGDRLYFLSDRSGTFNLYTQAASGAGEARRLTDFKRYGIRYLSLAAGSERLVLVRDGRIHLHELASGETREIPIRVDLPGEERETKTVTAGGWVAGVALAAAGDTVFVESRGDILRLGLEGETLSGENLTHSSGAADRDPAPSPDGARLAYFSDRSGEYQLIVRTLATGSENAISIEAEPSFYRQAVWSPDGRRIAFTGKRLGLWIADLEAGTARRVARSDYLAQELYHPAWSPDGRYLAYALGFPTHHRGIFLLDTQSGEHHRVSGPGHADRPVFDANGRYLHFLSSHQAPLAGANEIWGLLSAQLFAPMVTSTVHTVLLRDGEPPPAVAGAGVPHPAARPREVVADFRIDLDGIEKRIVALPVPPRDWFELAAGEPGVLYLRHRKWPEAPGGSAPTPTPLSRFVLGEKDGLTELVEDVDFFTLSADGSTAIYELQSDWYRVPVTVAATTPTEETQDSEVSADPELKGTKLALEQVEIQVDPGEEWAQIYAEAWRLMRDYFYDPNHHGQDIAALREHYATYLPGIARRSDLNLLLREALGHVSISHMSIGGGDTPRSAGERDRTGVLAADFEVDQGRYRIAKIYRRAGVSSWSSLIPAAPLDQPGLDVREGDYLLAVGDQPVGGAKNLYQAFAGTAYQPTSITVASDPEGHEKRELMVMPVGGANTIKRMDWFEENRQRVEELSAGRLAYVTAPNYGSGAIFELMGQLAVQADREGLIIDQRFGPGGTTSDQLVQMLTASPYHRYVFPYGADLTVPTTQLNGPKVVLINEHNGSASETFPLMFQIAEAGTLVGKRTAGAGTGGALSYPRMVDGGRVTIPNRASYNPRTGTWAENDGVHPDVEVEWWPEEWRRGEDPQLEKAVAIALEQLESWKPVSVQRPAFPVHPE